MHLTLVQILVQVDKDTKDVYNNYHHSSIFLFWDAKMMLARQIINKLSKRLTLFLKHFHPRVTRFSLSRTRNVDLFLRRKNTISTFLICSATALSLAANTTATTG